MQLHSWLRQPGFLSTDLGLLRLSDNAIEGCALPVCVLLRCHVLHRDPGVRQLCPAD